jgi:hypothetical protein
VHGFAGVDNPVDHPPGPGTRGNVDGKFLDPAAEMFGDRSAVMSGEHLVDGQISVRRVQHREPDRRVETEQRVEQPLGVPRGHCHPFCACLASRL